MADIRDVIARIIGHLSLAEAAHGITSEEAIILVAPEILPSQARLLEKFKVAGIITEAGGGTGHAAILARSLGIPSVSGLRGILKQVSTGDLIALDGRAGHVHLKPDRELEAAYRKLEREYFHLRDKLVENRDQEAITQDGTKIELLANVNNVHDAEAAVRAGATGVGLYRTEYLFLTHPSVPTEEEQLAAYKAIIETSPHRSVTIRSLDIGGDKPVPYFGHEREANPFMGWPSIRITSSYPEFFQTQLRAILRAGVHGNISLLFPMISTLEEVRTITRMVRDTKAALTRDFLPLLGMGLYRFSMSPAFVPSIKELARCATRDLAVQIAERVRRLRTFKQVRQYLTRMTQQVCPNVTFLDTKK